jgi:hypothetical protein
MPETLSRPHFVIIGAMKCATSTLHDQLARQPGVFMSTPKEPNFFSDDLVWARGLGWYASLFQNAPANAVCGESSTHYTKLPTHPHAAERLHACRPQAKLVYVMRDPIDRLVSHYIHEWTMREFIEPIDQAIRSRPELINYSRYAMQLRPWLERFGTDRVLPVFFERLTRDPDSEFARICRFVGVPGEPAWDQTAKAKNVSSERQQRNPVRDRILDIGLLKALRRTLLSESVRDRIKSRWRMEDRPELSSDARRWLAGQLDPDLSELGSMLGLSFSCAAYREAVLAPATAPEWAGEGAGL